MKGWDAVLWPALGRYVQAELEYEPGVDPVSRLEAAKVALADDVLAAVMAATTRRRLRPAKAELVRRSRKAAR